MRRRMPIVASLVLSLATGAFAQTGEDSLVGADDLLNVLVLDWDPVLGEVKPWEEVSGEYRVRADGTILVPFAGPVPGEGRSTDDIAADIVAALRERLALTVPPDVTVDLAVQRPVIVTGDVRSPGPYDFTPGMIAAEAVGLAGGTGSLIPDEASFLRELTSLRSAIEVLQSQELRLLARRARLQAELESRTEIEADEDLSENPEWAGIVALEEQLMQVRADRLARELLALDDQSALFAAEIQALEQKTVSLNTQRELASEAAANADDLVDRGLAAGQRLLETQNALASIDTQLLDVSTSILRARQDLASTERERIGLQDIRKAEILEALQEVEGVLQDTRQQIEGTRAAIRIAQAGRPTEMRVDPTIAVLRRGNGSMERIEDAAMLPLQPGDMVEVTQPILFGSDIAVGSLPDMDRVASEASGAEGEQPGQAAPTARASGASELLGPAEPGLADAPEDAADPAADAPEDLDAPQRDLLPEAETLSGDLPEEVSPAEPPAEAAGPELGEATAAAPRSDETVAAPPLRPLSRPESFN